MANTAFTHDPTITVPSSTVNNRVVTWNGTTGKVFDNTALVTIAAGVVAGVTTLTASTSITTPSVLLSGSSNTLTLDVAAVTAAYTIIFPDAVPGAAGKVLQSSGSSPHSTLAWVTPSGGTITDINTEAENRVATFGSTTTELDGEANLTFDGTNLTVGTGNVIIGTSGKGIDFSAATTDASGMTSEVLDDYEEGTWTPLAFDDSNSNSENQTYGAATAGSYTKIGNRVFIQGHLVMTSNGNLTAGQRLKIGGIPFTTSSSAPQASIAVGFGQALNISAGSVVGGYIGVGDVRILMRLWDSTVGQTDFTVGELSNDGDLRFFGEYFV